MKVIFIHKSTGFYVGGESCDKSYCKTKMMEKGISEDRADRLSDVIGVYLCVWEIRDGGDPYETLRDRLGDKASLLDWEDIIVEDYDDMEEEEDYGEID